MCVPLPTCIHTSYIHTALLWAIITFLYHEIFYKVHLITLKCIHLKGKTELSCAGWSEAMIIVIWKLIWYTRLLKLILTIQIVWFNTILKTSL